MLFRSLINKRSMKWALNIPLLDNQIYAQIRKKLIDALGGRFKEVIIRRGPGFLLLFSIKSKEEILCFAERVLNGRMTNVVQPPLSLYLDYSTKPAPHFLRLSYNSPSPFGCKIPLGLL